MPLFVTVDLLSGELCMCYLVLNQRMIQLRHRSNGAIPAISNLDNLMGDTLLILGV